MASSNGDFFDGHLRGLSARPHQDGDLNLCAKSGSGMVMVPEYPPAP